MDETTSIAIDNSNMKHYDLCEECNKSFEEWINSPIEPKDRIEKILKQIDNALVATDAKDSYATGMRNGMRYVKYLIDDVNPVYEDVEEDTDA